MPSLAARVQGAGNALAAFLSWRLLCTIVLHVCVCCLFGYQLIMGMSVKSYWASVWLWDFLQFVLPWLGSAILVAIFGGSAFHVRGS
jgi:hypothetical protein